MTQASYTSRTRVTSGKQMKSKEKSEGRARGKAVKQLMPPFNTATVGQEEQRPARGVHKSPPKAKARRSGAGMSKGSKNK